MTGQFGSGQLRRIWAVFAVERTRREHVVFHLELAGNGAEGQNRTVDTSLFRSNGKCGYGKTAKQKVTFRVMQFQSVTESGATVDARGVGGF